MSSKGKRYEDALKQINNELYEPQAGLELVKNLAKAKFDETIDVAFRLNLDPRHADQQVRGAIVLPHGTGKTRTVLVLPRVKAKEAEEAGADFVGAEEIAAIRWMVWF